MAEIYGGTKELNDRIAHMAGVKTAVHAHGREVQARATALFEPHNHPGRHEVTGEVRDTDYLVSLEGPSPASVEYGRGPETQTRSTPTGGKFEVHIGPAEGLHILGRAADL